MSPEESFRLGQETGIYKGGVISTVLVGIFVRSFDLWQYLALAALAGFCWYKYTAQVELFDKRLNDSSTRIGP